jgi:hypothetical protein
MYRGVGRVLSTLTFALLGVVVLPDGTSSVLVARDPLQPGRAFACYTALKLSVGVNEPSRDASNFVGRSADTCSLNSFWNEFSATQLRRVGLD